MKSRFVRAGLIGLLAVVTGSCSNSNGVVTGTGTGFMWVVTQGDQLVSAYNISLTNGGAGLVGTSRPTGAGPIAIALTPAGDALFVANRDDNTIGAYAVNSDGSLLLPCSTAGCNQIAAAPIAGTPLALAIDPSGKFLFVANQASLSLLPPPPLSPDSVTVFSINGAALTYVGAFPTIGNGPAGLVASPNGTYLYVANQYASTVSILSYDVNGTLTVAPTSPINVGTNPSGLAFSRCAGTTPTTITVDCPTAAPPGYLFVANSGSNDVNIFSACVQITTACPSANGTLTQIVGSPVSAGVGPISFMVNPARDLVYVVNHGSFQVSEYHYSSATGFLAALSPATASTGASPLTSGITSDGNWAFVPNNGGSSLSVYAVGVGGQLNTPTAVPLVGQPSAVLIR